MTALARTRVPVPAAQRWLGAVLVVVALAAAGWTLGRRLALAPERPRPAASLALAPVLLRGDGFSLEADAAWTPVRGAPRRVLPGLARRRVVALEPYAGLADTVQVATLPARSATLLPPALAADVSTASAQRVRVGGRPALLYPAVHADGIAVDAAVIPTTRGVVTLLCEVPVDRVSMPGDCFDGVRRLVPAAAPLPAGPATALRLRLPRVLARLDAARARDARRLRTARRAGQTAAAGRLARVHREAAAALVPFAPAIGPGAGLGQALDGVERAYARLWEAGHARERGAWNRARPAVARADATLRRELTALRRSRPASG